jgi:hypothetical protein
MFFQIEKIEIKLFILFYSCFQAKSIMDKIKFEDCSISMLSKFFSQLLNDAILKEVGAQGLNLDIFLPAFFSFVSFLCQGAKFKHKDFESGIAIYAATIDAHKLEKVRVITFLTKCYERFEARTSSRKSLIHCLDNKPFILLLDFSPNLFGINLIFTFEF